MGDNFEDQWEDLDEEVIKECIFIETQTLSQAPPTGISLSQSSNLNFQIERNKEKASFSRQQFPSLSSFYDDNPIKNVQHSNLQKVQRFPTPLNNKIYNAIPSKGGIFNTVCNVGNKASKGRPTNQLLQNQNDNPLENLKKENEVLVEENLIKQGEVYNLRCELKRKETALENERVDHCLAVEAAEKRGKEKSANSLKESELKVKTLQVEIEKLYGSLAFKNREVEELLARCQQLEHQQQQYSMGATANKKPFESSQSSKRFKRDILEDGKKSTSNWKTNFSDRFDFNGQKCEVKDVEIQTAEGNDAVRRYTMPIISKKGKMSNTKRALIIAHENYPRNQAITCVKNAEGLLKGEEISTIQFQNDILLLSQGKFDSTGSPSVLCDDYLIKSLCIQLENILTNFKNDRENENYQSRMREKYITVVSPLFNILRITSTRKEDILFYVIKTLTQHFWFIFKELNTNIPCLYSGFESLLFFSSCCSTLPLSLSESVKQLLTHGLEYLSSCTKRKILLLKILSSMIRIETFKFSICKNKAGMADSPCLLSQICSLFYTKDNISSEDLMLHLLVFISLLLQPPNEWLLCSCSSSLLHKLVKHLHYLTTLPYNFDGSTWHLILFGIKVLHKWQFLDVNWWDKIAPMPTYTILMGTVHRKCKILKTSGKLDQYIGELLYDLHGTDET